MYIVIIYLLIGLVVHFYMYKKHWNALMEEMEKYKNDCWLDVKEGWLITFVPIFWIISVPIMLLWILMELIYSKLNNKK